MRALVQYEPMLFYMYGFIQLKYLKKATVLLVYIFCSLCLRRHSKQEKLISAVLDVSILLFPDYGASIIF